MITLAETSTLSGSTPHKVHIRGLDDFTTADIKAFSAEHFPATSPTRVEWINDTSANIVFDSPATGLSALESLSQQYDPSMPILQLRDAKSFSTHPNTIISIRIAVTSDQKSARAHEASRFYMMHPEHDPREQRRRDHSRGNRYNNGDYRRRRYGDDENRRRRRRDEAEGFDASMYDDADSPSRRSSFASSDDGRASHGIDSHRPRRPDSRARSASPGIGSHCRRRTPPPPYHKKDPFPFPVENRGKELFASSVDKNGRLLGQGTHGSSSENEANAKKELFPLKANSVLHRRSDAFDAADETADLFATGMTVPFTDGPRKPKGLADRISFSKSPSRSTRESALYSEREADLQNGSDSISIKGTALLDQGMSIRGGAASNKPLVGKIKELFPSKVKGNEGKELFAEKLEGRGLRRNRAEDLFS